MRASGGSREKRFQCREGHRWVTGLNFFPPEGGVGVVPKRGYLLPLAYYAFPIRYEFEERRRNDILTGENRRTRRKTCPSVTLSTTNPTWIDPGANPSVRSQRPATNDRSHGTAYCIVTGVFVDSNYAHISNTKAGTGTKHQVYESHRSAKSFVR
jgi:hypothetical protein